MVTKRAQRKTRREKKRFKKRTFVIFISLLVIIASFLFIMNNEYLSINEVIVDGQKTIIKDDILKEVDDYLNNKILGLIRRDNILVLSTYGVEKIVKERFPKIEDINVRITEGDTLVITVGERSAHSLWCIERDYESVFDEECYFADQKGLLYARAPYFSGSVYMKLFIQPNNSNKEGKDEEENREIEYIGTKVSAVDSFEDFFNFLQEIEKQYSVDIARVKFREFGDVSIELNRVNNWTYDDWQPIILYNQTSDYERVLRNIGIVLNFEDFKKDFDYRSSALESIDVRFNERVSYLFTPIGKIPGNYIKKPNEENIETIE